VWNCRLPAEALDDAVEESLAWLRARDARVTARAPRPAASSPRAYRRLRPPGARGLGAHGRAAHDAPAAAAQAWLGATRAFRIGASPRTHALGRLDGEPVALGTIVPGVGVAGPSRSAPSRKPCRGIGAAVTLAAYDLVRDLGYRYGVRFSTELGLPVDRRAGFRDCGISRFLWRAG
jgi:hypothetical protein